MEIRQQEVFVAKDGEVFTDKNECEEWEKIVDRLNYFEVRHTVDTCETGLYVNVTYVAVYAENGSMDVVMNYFIKQFGYLIPSVQGYGYQCAFSVRHCKKEEYNTARPNMWGGRPTETKKILLSRIPLKGFPENIDFYKLWNFK
ncbi:MAG: hypothetical protein LBC68_11000 [Prevotellaceae bacterium]|jgi:hypothetical protein|nr:hypothetical protein [Prevotellaceae bacterium]